MSTNEQPIKTKSRDVQYIKHNNSNYKMNTLFHHMLSGELIKKEISRKSPRFRKAKLGLLDRLMNWFRG